MSYTPTRLPLLHDECQVMGDMIGRALHDLFKGHNSLLVVAARELKLFGLHRAKDAGHVLADRFDQSQLFLQIALLVIEGLGIEVLVSR